MNLDLNTLAAFDKNGDVVKTWNYELVQSKALLSKIRSICDEKKYAIRLCFNDDAKVEIYLEKKIQSDMDYYSI